MRRVMVVVLGTVVACALGAGPAGALRRSRAVDKLLSSARQMVDTVHQLGLESSQDVYDVKDWCGEARLSRFLPDKGPESRALLDRGLKLANEALARDFSPLSEPGGEYKRLEKRIEALAKTTTGVQRHELERAALQFEAARLHRRKEVEYLGRIFVAQGRLDCDPNDLENAAFTMRGDAETDEKNALGSLNLAAKSPKTQPRKGRPLEFRISVTYTATLAQSDTVDGGDTANHLYASGVENGTLTQTAVFPPVTVLPNGRFKPVTAERGNGTIAGTWSSSGEYYDEEDPTAHQTYSCQGPLVQSPDDVPNPMMTLDGIGSLATLSVELPNAIEGDQASCPDPGEHNTMIPTPFDFGTLAAHGELFEVALDGLALRQRYDTATIETGIEHLGAAFSELNCTRTENTVTSCSNAGSHVHDVVHISSVSGD